MKNRKAKPRARQASRWANPPGATTTKIAHVLSRMRAEGISLTQAAREARTSRNTVLRYAKRNLRKSRSGKYIARASDNLRRELIIPTSRGLREIVTSSSREASKLGQYWNAVQIFLQEGDEFALKTFRGESVTTASRERIDLITDLDELERLGYAGIFSFESIYARTA